MTHTEGDSFELVCAFVAIPVPDIRWEKDREIFPPGEGRRIINSVIVNGTGQSQLEIDSLVLSDAGFYTCIVTSPIGPAMRSVRLEVEGEDVRSLPTFLPIYVHHSSLTIFSVSEI